MSEYKLVGGAVMGKELGRIWEDMAAVYFEVSVRNFPGKTVENHEESQ